MVVYRVFTIALDLPYPRMCFFSSKYNKSKLCRKTLWKSISKKCEKVFCQGEKIRFYQLSVQQHGQTIEGQPADSHWFICLTLNIHNCRLRRVNSASPQPVFRETPPLWCCSSFGAPHGRVVLTFSILALVITINYLLCSQTWLNPGSSIPPTPTPLSPRLQISQRRAARIDTGRSNKAGRLRGHRGAAHTDTPAITTSSPALPTPPLTYLSGLHGLLDLFTIIVIKETMNRSFIITADTDWCVCLCVCRSWD